MKNISTICVQIDANLKEEAEKILSQLGVSPSGVIQRLYSQIVMTKGIPLDLHLPSAQPTAISGMHHAQLNAELLKGVESINSGKSYTADEVDAELFKEFGI